MDRSDSIPPRPGGPVPDTGASGASRPEPAKDDALGSLGALGRNAARNAEADRRRAGRMRVEGIGCNLGQVVDLSATGMQVLMKSRKAPADPGCVAEVVLSGGDLGIRLRARVVRVREAGRRIWALHLHFLETTESHRRMLTALAFENRKGRTTL